MADRKKPWELATEEPAPEPRRDDGRERPWSRAAEEPAAPPPPDKRDRILPTRPLLGAPPPNTSAPMLPVSYDENGKPQFDSNAGILGAIKRTFTLPREVYEGAVQLNTPEGRDRTMEAAFTLTPAGSFGGRSAQVLGGTRQAAPVPGSQALRGAGGRTFEELGREGIDYAPNAVATWADQTQQTLLRRSNATRAPATHSVLDQLRQPPRGAVAVPFANMHDARKALSEIRAQRVEGKATPDALAAARALEQLDGFMGRNAVGDLAPGSSSAATVGPRMRDANANYAAGERGSQIDEISRTGGLQAGAAHSGGNLDNTLRQRLRTHLTAGHGKRTMGWNEGEISAAERAVEGGMGRNALRRLSNMLGGGGGAGAGWTAGIAGAATGAATLDPMMSLAVAGAAPSLGFGLKGIENRMAQGAIDRVGSTIRQRSPLANQWAAQSRANPTFNDPLVQALTARAAAAPQPQDPRWYEQEDMKRRIAAGQVI